MKLSNIKYGILAMLAIAFASCEEEGQVQLKSSAIVEPTVSDDALVLVKENENEDALTVAWPEPDYGFTASPTYMIYLDKESGDFSAATVVSTGNNLSKTFTVKELNSILLGLEFEDEVESVLKIRVDSRLGPTQTIQSEVMTIDVTPYKAFLNLLSGWGVVGGAYNNWGNGPDAPFYTTGTPGTLVSYVTVRAGEIKFRKDNLWVEDFGDNGANGSLEAGGANIVVTAGPKKITWNTTNNTYTIEDYSWGVVGSAWNNWGNGEGTPLSFTPDLEFWYDDATDTWKTIGKLKAGEFKIRKNNAWTVDYGDTDADGTLELGGSNIVTTAGTFLITLDFNEMTITKEPIDYAWGLVGSAYNNWGGDAAPANGIQDLMDAQFIRDSRNENIWYLKNIVLMAGEFKIRDGNAWVLDYGDNGANGSLEAGGANIAALAGLHTITLDFTNPTAPTITIVKHAD